LLLVVVCLLILAVYARVPKDRPDEFTLTILHTNDVHAHDLPFMERGRSVGGMARIAYLIRRIRDSCKDVVAVDAGDFFQGTPLFERYQGEIEVNCLNKAGYDLVTLGNHEFDNGPEILGKNLRLANFAITSCNLDCSKAKELEMLVKPSIVKVFNGEKVAFIGAITPDLEHVTLKSKPVEVTGVGDSWMEPIAAEVERIKQRGINKIVLVTHLGLELDKQLAQSLSDADVIIGGHSHTRLDQPIWVEHKDATKTVIVQTGSYGRTLGKLTATFDKVGHLIETKTQSHLISITDRLKEAPDVASYLSEKTKPLEYLRQEIVGYASSEFDNRFNNMPWDSAIGDLICDALVEAGTEYGAKISLQNRGGIRARIEAGAISEEKVRELLPFDNKVVLATVKGDRLLNVLERSVAGPLGGSFLEVHGLKIGYDPLKPKGARIIFALAENEHGDWQPIDLHGSYKIALNDYTFKGGEGYDFSQSGDVVYLPELLSQTLHKYLLRQKGICAKLPNRIAPLTSELARIISISSKSGPVLKVFLPFPSCKVTIVTGNKLGVESVTTVTRNPLPVPLEKPCVLKRSPLNRMNGCQLFDLSDLTASEGTLYIAAVCRKQGSASARATQVSYPIRLLNKAAFSR